MRVKLIICTFFIGLIFFSCSTKKNTSSQLVKISTEYGDITIKLYDKTPIHRDNFLKLSNDKFYNGQIFHRVIKDFVIQAGDPDTKNSEPYKLYGEKDSGYLLDAEFNDSLIHKYGAVGMAREGDDVNPLKKSSGSQFYIVIGKIFTSKELDNFEDKINAKKLSNIKDSLFNIYLKNDPDVDKLALITQKVNLQSDSIFKSKPSFKLSELQRKYYTTVGGIPHLDGNYTIFGEVIEGMDVVKKISLVKTDKNDRPIKDIKLNIKVL